MAPTNISQLVSVAVLSFIAGFYVKPLICSKLRSKKTSKPAGRAKQPKPPVGSSEGSTSETGESEEYEEDSESEYDIEIDSKPLNEIPGECRMTLIVRQDLKMGKGKAAAQCSHATLALYKKITDPESVAYNPEMVRRWEYGNGQAKITLQVPDAEAMDMLYAQAISLGINSYVVHDAGRTQIAAGSATVLGLGPAPKSVIDQITNGLKLY